MSQYAPARYTDIGWGEIRYTALAGIDRTLWNVNRGSKQRHQLERVGIQAFGASVVGAIGEFAVCTALDFCWRGGRRGFDRDGDVHGLHVRSTEHERGALLVYPDDPDHAPMVLVAGFQVLPPSAELIGGGVRLGLPGWIEGAAAKRDEWWREPHDGKKPDVRAPGFRVPQRALVSLDDLVSLEAFA